MIKSTEISLISIALQKAQNEMFGAKKGSKNPFFKSTYANLTSIIIAIKQPLFNNDLSYTQTLDTDENGSYVETLLMHKSGQFIGGKIRLELSKKNMQDLGSAITYARRYSLESIVGLNSVDDDGEKTMIREISKKVSNTLTETNLREISKTLAKNKFVSASAFISWRCENNLAPNISNATDIELRKINSMLEILEDKKGN